MPTSSERNHGTMTQLVDRKMLTIKALYEWLVEEKTDPESSMKLLMLKTLLLEIKNKGILEDTLAQIATQENAELPVIEISSVIDTIEKLINNLKSESSQEVNILPLQNTLRILWLKGIKLWEEKKRKADEDLS